MLGVLRPLVQNLRYISIHTQVRLKILLQRILNHTFFKILCTFPKSKFLNMYTENLIKSQNKFAGKRRSVISKTIREHLFDRCEKKESYAIEKDNTNKYTGGRSTSFFKRSASCFFETGFCSN